MSMRDSMLKSDIEEKKRLIHNCYERIAIEKKSIKKYQKQIKEYQDKLNPPRKLRS